MTNTSIRRAIARISYCGILPLLTLAACVGQGSEATVASAHICSGCASCDQITAPPPNTNEHNCVDHLHRAGHPETQGRFAKPSLNKHDSFGYIGGGAALWGEPRFPDEGTWGVDYSGILIKRKIWLPWLHGHHEPRHDGSYRTDGPYILRH